MTVLKRNSLARHVSRLRITHTGSKKASYRDLVRTTGIPLSVLHAIAQGKIAIPGWIEKLEAAHNAEWRLVTPRRRRRAQHRETRRIFFYALSRCALQEVSC